MKDYSGVNREAVKVTSNMSVSSFVEAVRGLPKTENPKVFNDNLCKFADVKDKGSDMVEVVSWDEEENASMWLSFCAVGVFKKVAGVSSVTERLREKNILSSCYYLVDKNILWSFKSIDDRNAFIRSRNLWEDLFSFIGGWSSAITPQCRLSWVEFRGIPLNVWRGEFFLKLGWAVGEPLLIEKKTLNRENLFGGKVLTLIPNGDTAVLVGAGVNAPIMKQTFPRIEQLKASCSKTSGAAADKSTTFQLSVTKKSASRKVVQFELGLGSGKDMGSGFGNTKNGFLVKPKLACGLPKRAQLKEIGSIINNEDINKSAAHIGQPNMELGKGKSVERSWSSEDSGESSFEESDKGLRLQCKNFGGESSKSGLDNLVGGNIVIDLSRGGEMRKQMGHSFKEALVNGGSVLLMQVKNSVGQRSTDSESEKEISSEVSHSSSDKSISHVSETQQLDRDNLVAKVVANSSGRLRKVSSKKVTKTISSVKRHGMKTRKDRNSICQGLDELRKGISSSIPDKDRWDVDVELSKVVEKGVELGYLKFPKSVNNGGVANEGRGDSSAEARSLNEEVAKVIEMEVELGFDFNGSVDKVAAEISRREKDDETRYLATK
ncbi:hypothetical protein Dsin_023182 [Dipteronia sinensis]|uniref:DUF4283 domain-containing protein n=1 Tax=Dipteronia sinensis TaxID=43782 RepID=A0AAE0E1U7_9ROSI|nr:hypothetical protein Dsin_023182 [Dipteronia sinensis]